MPKPTDSVALTIIAGLYAEEADIAAWVAKQAHWTALNGLFNAETEKMEGDKALLQTGMVSKEWDGSVHEEADCLVRAARQDADNAAVIARYIGYILGEVRDNNRTIAAIANQAAQEVRELSRQGPLGQQAAAARFDLGRQDAERTTMGRVPTIQSWIAKMKSELRTDTFAASGGGASSSDSSHQGNGNGSHVSPVDWTTGDEGGQGSPNKPNRVSEDSNADQAGENGSTADRGKEHRRERIDESSSASKAGEGHSSAGAGRVADSSGSNAASRPGVGSAAGAGLGSGSLPTSGLGGGSGSGGGLGGGAGGLGGLTNGLGGSTGNVRPAGLEGMSAPRPVGLAPPGSLSSAGTGGGAAGGGSGSGGPSVRVSTPPPTMAPAPTISAVGPGTSQTPAVTPPPVASATQSVSSGGQSGAGMVPVGAGAAPGAAAPATTPTPPPSAPTTGPGPSAGLPPAAASQAAGAAGAAGQGVMSVVPSEGGARTLGSDRRDRYAEQAVAAVESLMPGLASEPGMLLAAGIIRVGDSVPQTVFTTGDGAGYLPEGFFMPPSVLHAFADAADDRFASAWYGWADPARVLLEYAGHRAESSGVGVEVLGLASAGVVTQIVKDSFPRVVSMVSPVQGAKAIDHDGGRNAHRLKVVAPKLYTELIALDQHSQLRAAVQAVALAMQTSAAAPLWAPGSVWPKLQSGGIPTAEMWSALSDWYREESITSGSRRPGWMENAQPGQDLRGYRQGFMGLRAAESLLAWNSDTPSAPDIIYSAYQAGADINSVLVLSA